MFVILMNKHIHTPEYSDVLNESLAGICLSSDDCDPQTVSELNIQGLTFFFFFCFESDPRSCNGSMCFRELNHYITLCLFHKRKTKQKKQKTLYINPEYSIHGTALCHKIV